MIRKKMDHKWQLKIACLLAAIILWFFIINEQNPISEGSYTVPVVIENLDSQYITSNVPKTVYVRLTGPRNTIIKIGTNDIKAYIDMSNVREGDMNVPVRVEIPGGTELKKQSVTTANITVDVYAVKELALTPHLTGKSEGNTYLSAVKIVPEKVVISGARRLIEKADKAVIEIPVDGKSEDFSVMTPIRLLTADGTEIEGLELTPWQSSVKVSIGHNAVIKTVPVRAATVGEVAPGYRVSELKTSPSQVTVKGESRAVSSLTEISLDPVSIDGLKEDKTWKVTVPGLGFATIEPDELSVSLTVEKEE